jgi:hypothetical protein
LPIVVSSMIGYLNCRGLCSRSEGRDLLQAPYAPAASTGIVSSFSFNQVCVDIGIFAAAASPFVHCRSLPVGYGTGWDGEIADAVYRVLDILS